jgi:uncharacterized YccA/Bax inhibitor family protein
VVGATRRHRLLYLVSMVLSYFHVGVPFSMLSPLSIGGISLVIIGGGRAQPGARLRPDRDRRGAGRATLHGVVRAFGLLVTLVWLYLEILRFLSKVRQR